MHYICMDGAGFISYATVTKWIALIFSFVHIK